MPDSSHGGSADFPALSIAGVDVATSLAGKAASAHKTQHEDGGSDELNVTGLAGLLADDQNPVAHAADHGSAGSDPVTIGINTQTTGVLDYTRGGTGQSSVSTGDLLLGNPVVSDIWGRLAKTASTTYVVLRQRIFAGSPETSWGLIINEMIDAAAGIAWTKVSKVGALLSDFGGTLASTLLTGGITDSGTLLSLLRKVRRGEHADRHAISFQNQVAVVDNTATAVLVFTMPVMTAAARAISASFDLTFTFYVRRNSNNHHISTANIRFTASRMDTDRNTVFSAIRLNDISTDQENGAGDGSGNHTPLVVGQFALAIASGAATADQVCELRFTNDFGALVVAANASVVGEMRVASGNSTSVTLPSTNP